MSSVLKPQSTFQKEKSIEEELYYLKGKTKQKCLQIIDLQAFNLLTCGRVGIRTPNLLIRSEMLYPVELRNHFPVSGLQR